MNAPWPDAMSLGEMIRRQRELTALPMRQLAAMAGISNPYLSQIERGLREPSEQVLKSLADSLELSADALRPAGPQAADEAHSAVLEAIAADSDLTPQQRKARQESYRAFREVTIDRRQKSRSRRPR